MKHAAEAAVMIALILAVLVDHLHDVWERNAHRDCVAACFGDCDEGPACVESCREVCR